MKQPLDRLIDRHRMGVQGVIHIGGNTGEEYDMYRKCNINPIIWFEPGIAHKDIQGGLVMPFALGAERREDFLWESFPSTKHTSFLQPYLHLLYYPDIGFRSALVSTDVYRLDAFYNKDIPSANFIVLDTNGYELEVLKGAAFSLPFIKYIYTEIYSKELYKDVPMVEQIDEYLIDFTRVETWWYEHGWGDALYIQK